MPPRSVRAAVLDALERCGPLDDDQLGAALGVSRQSARSVALRMCDAGLVTRVKPAGSKWITTIIADGGSAVADPDPRQGTRQAPFDESAAVTALSAIYAFTDGKPPRTRIAALEQALGGADLDQVSELLRDEMVTDSTLSAGLLVKSLAGEINVLIHALGILLTLPHILIPGEQVLSASLGAGTGGKHYDLETTHRVAEFKFTRWRGHDAVRQRELFADFVNLAEDNSGKLRSLYITGNQPERFLRTSKRQLASVCERRPEILALLQRAHGGRYRTVGEYYSDLGDRVEIVDLTTLLPGYQLDA